MEDNNRVVDKIDTLMSTKFDELIALQGEKEDLRQNMADPDTLNENAFDVDQKQRELNVLQEVRDYAIETGARVVKDVFDQMLDNYQEVIKDHEEQGSNATEEKLNYNSLKIVCEEIEASNSNDSNNEDDQDNGSAPMDISSSDDSGE